jgi:type IV fimbrial biogenesis protein FimT
LFELMVTLAVAAVLAAIAVPNMRDFIRNNRLASTSNDILRSTQIARSEAVKRQRVVTVCSSSNTSASEPTCSGGAFSGWIVFEDANNNWARDNGEEVIERQRAPNGISISNDSNGRVSFAATGFANSTPGQTPVSRIVLCDARGNKTIGDSSVARALIIETTGRTRITRDPDEVTAALSITGGSCP